MAQKVYNRIYWENEPSHVTPLSESNLNRIDAALDTVDTRVVELYGYETRAEQAVDDAEQAVSDAEGYVSQAQTLVNSASTSATNASNSARLAESHNHGNTGARTGENTDNAKYWSQQAQSYAQTASTYEADVVAAKNTALAQIQDALGETSPIWTVNLTNGHIYYSGGRFTFVLASNGHLQYEITT